MSVLKALGASARYDILAPAIMIGLATPALAADILPGSGAVAAGDASIAISGPSMTITQSSDAAIINWQSFSIGENNSVNFVQPGKTASTLNRVTGTTSSTIAGQLTANGQVFLINPNGIAITPTGTVKVGGGFVASTLGITDEDFLNGNLAFRGDGSSAATSNGGVVTVGRGGYAALIGGTVRNDGLIAVPLGKAGLGSGEEVTLDLAGDGFLQVAVPTAGGSEGDGALIDNAGVISANGGVVVMKAATARQAARSAINMSGVVEANSVGGRNGAIVLGGGSGGNVRVAGKVHAKSDDGRGGGIEITGKAIELAGADVDASGAGGGGRIRIGGDRHGEGELQRAETTAVDAETTIRADATESGDGGDVVVWSDVLTTFDGLITARGAGSGVGGEAEVSGKARLAYTGFADLSGPGGFGTLLLDPYNITISEDAASNSSGTTATGDDSIINVATLASALSGANVEISTNSGGTQAGDITIASAISWDADTVLSLVADNDINIFADITATGDSAGLVLNSGGDYRFFDGASATLAGAGASLKIDNVGYTLIHSMAEIDAIDASTSTPKGNYALVQDLDASGTTYDHTLVGGGGNKFQGVFTGLGHTISGFTLVLDDPDSGSSTANYGLFGRNFGTVRDIGLIDASLTATDATFGNFGLLVGWNKGPEAQILNAYTTGEIDVAFDAAGNNPPTVGGLAGYSYEGALIANSYSTADITAFSSANGMLVGGLVGRTQGKNSSSHISIVDSYATGNVKATSTATGNLTDSFLRVGGLVGSAERSEISTSYATGKVEAIGTEDTVDAGGLIGHATGVSGDTTHLSQVYASGEVTATNTVGDAYAGGLIGTTYLVNLQNSYALGGVTANGTTTSGAGGLVGRLEFSTAARTYATGLTIANDATRVFAGGVVGYYTLADVYNSFFDTQTTGLSVAAGNTTQSGVAEAVGLTTAQFQDTASFLTLAENDGSRSWDFGTVWAPPSDGYYPELYALTPVVWVDSFNTSSTYGDSTANVTAINSAHGGTGSYVFGRSDDGLDLVGLSVDSDPTASAGSSTSSSKSTNAGATSDRGVGYRIFFYGDQTADIAKAALTIKADSATKVYGTEPTLTDYSVDGILNSDAVTAVDIASDGTVATANVGSYDIVASNAVGSGLSNYEISYDTGTLNVTRAALTITAENVEKVYGAEAVLADFSVDGLVNSDTVSAVDLASDGVGATANAGSYDITASNAVGSGLSNYEISYETGTLEVTKAALTITPDDAAKTYGADLTLDGYSVSGLLNQDSVIAVELASAGTAATANVGTYDITASNALGLGLSNYEISYRTGTLTVSLPLAGAPLAGNLIPFDTPDANWTTLAWGLAGAESGMDGASAAQPDFGDPYLVRIQCALDPAFSSICSTFE